MQGVYARNAYDILMLGGYYVNGITDTVTGKKGFSNLNTLSCWTDIQTTGKMIKFGLFYGYTENIGAGKKVEGPVYGRGTDIANVFRISPRMVYEIKPLTISVECEYTGVYFGLENGDGKGGVTDTDLTGNWRGVLSFKYSF